MTMDLTNFANAVASARSGRSLATGSESRRIVDVSAIPGADELPACLVVLLENVVRRAQTDEQAVLAASRIIDASRKGSAGEEIEFMPARVLFQDFTGVPVFVDFAAMRDAMVERGGDPCAVNPRIPCTLVIDHSVTADVAGRASALDDNLAIEADRNRERFSFLKWASRSFDNVRIVPPGRGICHQLNIESFCEVVSTDALWRGNGELACFDTVVGTDSHTPTANGIGVLGWGVGGIEAEAAALGQPISMRVPEVVGLHLTGRLGDSVSAMDLALTVAERLRAEGVVGCLVEAFGPGVSTLTVTQRACVSNMTPEYGATSTLFPVDENVLDYLRLTGREASDIEFVEAYARAQGVFGSREDRRYARVIELDLSSVELSLAGPSRPHNRVTPSGLKERFETSSAAHGHSDMGECWSVTCEDGSEHELGHGTLAIAAITSCTTATDPAMMVAAGLAARHAHEAGLEPKPWVKRILAPGSRAASLILERAGLLDDLRAIGFYTCGFGCMSCIGNSGDILSCLKPLATDVELTSVLSGNRNFDGRISPDVAQNFLAQPALVVAYSLVGTMDVDLSSDPVGISSDGSAVYLRDIMPTSAEVQAVLDKVLTLDVYERGMLGLMDGEQSWRSIESSESATFAWDESSTYVRRPPYFEIARAQRSVGVEGARALALFGDFVTTDHISPAGAISPDSPCARYLLERGVSRGEFNTYGSRRGNHECMARGTFANVKLDNRLAGRPGPVTRNLLSGEVESVFDAAESYGEAGVPLVIVAGRMYGSGSSRDWAAKGPLLLGVRAVIAESFERIHRSNLVQMGILPLEFAKGSGAAALGLDGTEVYDIEPVDLAAGLPARPRTTVTATRADGTRVTFDCVVRVDTALEGAFLRNGGILPYVLEELS
ncbi:aconitate hydratase AcnA [Parolsenella catena]|uniref:aconitate hydratase AcnA n=1 Tax=Parolsenella catena TaxID=2003188 RepID=UPI003F9E15F0